MCRLLHIGWLMFDRGARAGGVMRQPARLPVRPHQHADQHAHIDTDHQNPDLHPDQHANENTHQ